MGFRETGYFFLLVIVFFNIGLTFFAPGATPSSYLIAHAGAGLQNPGEVIVGQIPTTNPNGSTFVSGGTTGATPPSTNPAEKPTNDLFPEIYSLINDLAFSGANAIEQSGLPSPLNWIFAFIIRLIVVAYVFIFGLDIINAVRGGGSIQ